MFRNLRTIWFTMILICISSSLAFAEASLSVVSSGNGVYTVQGDGLSGVGGIDLTINFDKGSLSSPKVTQGSLVGGSFMMANENFAPGSIKIAIVSTSGISGSGPLAVITFGNHGSGSVQIANSKLIDTSGKSVASGQMDGPSSVVSSTPGIPFSKPTTTTPTTTPTTTTPAATPSSTSGTLSSTTSGSSTTPSTVISSNLGTVSQPTDSQPRDDVKPAETTVSDTLQQPPADSETTAAAAEPLAVENPAEPAPSTDAKQAVYGSVLERFRTYQGEKTPATMMALFTKAVAPMIHQEPAIAISDGKTNIRVIADLAALAGSSPNFALNGARMVSLKKGDVSGRWILEALPNKDVMTASVTILSNNSVIEYPLTTVLSGVRVSAEESGFSDFLKDADVKSPKRDLNSDKRHDYLDDYIYTALYLVKKNGGQLPQ